MTNEVLIVCLEIFFCRIMDVSLMTIRMVLTIKEKPAFAAITGFFEAGIWFLVVRNALNTGDGGIYVALAYAAGFATGTFCGGLISRALIHGNVTVQVITSSRDDEMIEKIRAEGYALTVVNVNSSSFGEEKYMVLAEMNSTKLKEFKALVNSMDPRAFLMVNETKYVFNGFSKKV